MTYLRACGGTAIGFLETLISLSAFRGVGSWPHVP